MRKITTTNLIFTILLFNLVTSAPKLCSDTAEPMTCCMSSGPQEDLAPTISAQACACHLSSNPASAPVADAALIVTPNSKKAAYDIAVHTQSIEAICSHSNEYAALNKARSRPKVGSDLKLYDLLSSYLI